MTDKNLNIAGTTCKGCGTDFNTEAAVSAHQNAVNASLVCEPLFVPFVAV